jgi:hypothetical protein
MKKLADLKLAKADEGMKASTAHSGPLPIIYPTGWEQRDTAEEWKAQTLTALAARLGPASLQVTPVVTPPAPEQPKAKRARQSTKPEAPAPAAPAQVIEALLHSDGAEPTPELIEAVLTTALRTPQGRTMVAERLARSLAEQGS